MATMNGTVPEYIDHEDGFSNDGPSNNSVHNNHSLPSPPDIIEDFRQEIKYTKRLALSLQGYAIIPANENSQNGLENDLQFENDQLKEKLRSLEKQLASKDLHVKDLKDRHRQDLGQKDAEIKILEKRLQKAEQAAQDALVVKDPATAKIWQRRLMAEKTKYHELSLQIEILDRKLLAKDDSNEAWKLKYVCFS